MKVFLIEKKTYQLKQLVCPAKVSVHTIDETAFYRLGLTGNYSDDQAFFPQRPHRHSFLPQLIEYSAHRHFH